MSKENHGETKEQILEYLVHVTWLIRRAWFPPKNYDFRATATVTFKIHKDGRISDVYMKKAADTEDTNDTIYSALSNASPFPSLPQGIPASIDLEAQFGASVFIRTVPSEDREGEKSRHAYQALSKKVEQIKRRFEEER